MCCWYLEKAREKPRSENKPGTPLATSWSCLSSDGTVYRLRATAGACLLYGVAVSRPVWRRASQAIGRGRIRSQPRPQSGRRRQQAALLCTAEPSCRVSDGSEAGVDVAIAIVVLIILARGTCALTRIAQSPPALACQRSPRQTATRLCAFHPLDRPRPQSHTNRRPPGHYHAARPCLPLLLRACRPLAASPLSCAHAGPPFGWPRERPMVLWGLLRAALV